MLKKTALTLGTAAMLFTTHGLADVSAVNTDKKIELGVGVQGAIEGSEGDALDNSAALLLQAGYRFGPYWSVIGKYAFASGVAVGNQLPKTDIHRIIANMHLDIFSRKNYALYLLVAAGYESFTDTAAQRNGFIYGFGGGIRYYFTENYGLNLGITGKHNAEHEDQSLLLDATVTYRF
jgi:hypothetical protein